MGHSQSEKNQTHERILEVAARRFRERGIEGISISEIMGEVGVTVGGFYKHFSSRDDLVSEAIALAFSKTSGWKELAGSSLSDAIDQYLENARDEEVPWCTVFSCLTADIRRGNSTIRGILDDHLQQSLRAVESGLSQHDDLTRSRKAATVLAAIVGAGLLARAASDDKLAFNLLSSVSDELRQSYLTGSSPQIVS